MTFKEEKVKETKYENVQINILQSREILLQQYIYFQ